MDVPFERAADTIDRFEEILSGLKISIPKNKFTGADMLDVWRILKFARDPASERPADQRPLLTTSAFIFDLAAKVVAVHRHADFEKLVPHLKLLEKGAVSLVQPPNHEIDTYNKLVELYWACLCLAKDIPMSIDDPNSAKGDNPDVLTGAGGGPRGYAMKTIRAQSSQTIFERITEGVAQIERSAAKTGIVVLQLTPRLIPDRIWRDGESFIDAAAAAAVIGEQLQVVLRALIKDIPQSELNSVFDNRKAVRAILCLGFGAASIIHPIRQQPVASCVKVLSFFELDDSDKTSMVTEIATLNDAMQTVL